MQTQNPKNTRGKRLHIVYFVDASQTKSISVSLRALIGAAVGLVLLTLGAIASISLYLQGAREVAHLRNFVKELKAGVLAQGASGYRLAFDHLDESMEKEIAATVALASSIRESSNRPAVGGNRLLTESAGGNPFLTQKLSAIPLDGQSPDTNAAAPTAAPQGVVELPKTIETPRLPEVKITPVVVTPALAVTAQGAATAAQTPAIVPPPSDPTSGVSFQNLRLEDSEENDEGVVETTLSFELVSADPTHPRSVTGRVCLVAERAEGDEDHLTVPAKLSIDEAGVPTSRCTGGQLVRFARLRPTSIVLPVKRDELKKITLFFAESRSGKLISHQVADLNSL